MIATDVLSDFGFLVRQLRALFLRRDCEFERGGFVIGLYVFQLKFL